MKHRCVVWVERNICCSRSHAVERRQKRVSEKLRKVCQPGPTGLRCQSPHGARLATGATELGARPEDEHQPPGRQVAGTLTPPQGPCLVWWFYDCGVK